MTTLEHVQPADWAAPRGYSNACTRELGRVYREIFGKHYPAMALIVVAGLLEDSALLEIEALAAIP